MIQNHSVFESCLRIVQLELALLGYQPSLDGSDLIFTKDDECTLSFSRGDAGEDSWLVLAIPLISSTEAAFGFKLKALLCSQYDLTRQQVFPVATVFNSNTGDVELNIKLDCLFIQSEEFPDFIARVAESAKTGILQLNDAISATLEQLATERG